MSMNYPVETMNFLKTFDNICLLQIIRNPVDATLSFMKSHNIEPFENACEDIIQRTHIAYTLCQNVSNPSYYIYYEDLLVNPKNELHKMLDWLNVDYSSNWIEKISQKINSPKNAPAHKQHYSIVKRLIDQYNAQEEFEKYQFTTKT